MQGKAKLSPRLVRRATATGVRTLLAFGLLAWVALPVGGYLTLTESTRSASLDSPVDVWAPAEPNVTPSRRTISVVVARADAVELYAPEWNGLVEAADLRPERVVKDGDIVATIGMIDRPAVSSERPFGRELRAGDEGSDVRSLNRFLDRRGLPASDSDKFTSRTLSSVRALADDLGVPGAISLEAFDPAWVVFLPEDQVRVSTSTLRVGMLAPAAGQSLAISRPNLSSVVLDAVRSSEAGEAGGVQSALAAAEGERLEIGGRDIPLSGDRAGVDPAGWEVIDEMVDPTQSRIDAVLISEPIAGTWVVPSAAVGSRTAGPSCLVRRGVDGTETRIDVALLSSSLGRSVVSGSFASGDEVLVASSTGESPCS